MDFYTVVIRQSAGYWVSLCLENGIVGQGNNQQESVDKLKEAIESFQAAQGVENNIYTAPVSIEELHEFLMLEDKQSDSEIYELRKVYA